MSKSGGDGREVSELFILAAPLIWLGLGDNKNDNPPSGEPTNGTAGVVDAKKQLKDQSPTRGMNNREETVAAEETIAQVRPALTIPGLSQLFIHPFSTRRGRKSWRPTRTGRYGFGTRKRGTCCEP